MQCSYVYNYYTNVSLCSNGICLADYILHNYYVCDSTDVLCIVHSMFVTVLCAGDVLCIVHCIHTLYVCYDDNSR